MISRRTIDRPYKAATCSGARFGLLPTTTILNAASVRTKVNLPALRLSMKTIKRKLLMLLGVMVILAIAGFIWIVISG
jgi:hypothetical protein